MGYYLWMDTMPIGDKAFAITGSFLFGIFAANEAWNVPMLGLVIILCGLIFLFISKKWLLGKFVISLFVAAVVGVAYYHAYVGWQSAHVHIPSGKQTSFFATVVAEPKPAGSVTMLAAEFSGPYSGALDIFIPSYERQFDYGDFLWVKGTVVSASKGTDEPPGVFFPQLRVVAQDQGSWWQEKVIAIKLYIVQAFDRVLSPDHAALLAAIIVGSASGLSAVLKAQMETSGTSYIVGMYGYKIAIIIATLALMLKNYLPRKALFFMTLLVLWIFVIASGAGVSVIRAAIMGSIVLFARGSGKTFSARNALAFAAVGMVIANAAILTDAAFQLSFLSFLGIYYLGPPIRYFFGWEDDGALQWKEHAMLSLSTNLAILPIVMNTFGGFSLTSFASNVFIMIPWPLLLAGGACIIVAGLISSYLVFFVAFTTNVILAYELSIIKIFSVFTIPMPSIFGSPAVIALYYGILLIFAYYYAAPSKKNH